MERPSDAAPVLVIEDDEGIRQALAQALEEDGHAVVCADNGRQALTRLAMLSPAPKLILLDLMMPVMDGHAFLDQRRCDPRLRDIPVVVVTADLRAAREPPRPDVQATLAKPISLDELLAAVARFAS